MRLLLDTHAVVWSVLDVKRLSQPALDAITTPDAQVHVSIASIWEIAIKVGLGKWPDAKPVLADAEDILERARFEILPITVAHVRAAGLMVCPHRDPFDRLLAAQASIEGLTLVTADPRLAGLGAAVLW